MPVPLTYPGVYIEEVPSGVRSIAGVATSITLFVGWAPKGDTDRATPVNSWAEYERRFGGLDARSLLGYSVSHFFQNGGSQAIIARIVNTSTAAGAIPAGPATAVHGTITLTARNAGIWARQYSVRTIANPADATRFTLRIVVPAAGTTPE